MQWRKQVGVIRFVIRNWFLACFMQAKLVILDIFYHPGDTPSLANPKVRWAQAFETMLFVVLEAALAINFLKRSRKALYAHAVCSVLRGGTKIQIEG